MELRDTIALEAMKVMLKYIYGTKQVARDTADHAQKDIPKRAYAYADEMLAVRGVDLRTMEDE